MARALPQTEAMFQSLFQPCIGSQGETPFSLRQVGKMFSSRTGNFATLIQPFLNFSVIFRLSKAPRTLLHALFCHPRQIYIFAAAINAEDSHHILSSLPTGMGKILPMIVASCLLPPGVLSCFSMKRNESCLSMPRKNLLSLLQIIFQGLTTMIIVPLTTIKQQLEDDCTRLGISFLVGDQVNPRLDSASLSHRTLAV